MNDYEFNSDPFGGCRSWLIVACVAALVAALAVVLLWRPA